MKDKIAVLETETSDKEKLKTVSALIGLGNSMKFFPKGSAAHQRHTSRISRFHEMRRELEGRIAHVTGPAELLMNSDDLTAPSD